MANRKKKLGEVYVKHAFNKYAVNGDLEKHKAESEASKQEYARLREQSALKRREEVKSEMADYEPKLAGAPKPPELKWPPPLQIIREGVVYTKPRDNSPATIYGKKGKLTPAEYLIVRCRRENPSNMRFGHQTSIILLEREWELLIPEPNTHNVSNRMKSLLVYQNFKEGEAKSTKKRVISLSFEETSNEFMLTFFPNPDPDPIA